MAFLNECYFRAAAGGTSDFVVSTAIDGFFTPAQCTNPAVVDGALYYYRAESDDLTEHESGYGPYTASVTTLARSTVAQSSNAGAKVNFTAAPRVRIEVLALNPLKLLADSLEHGFGGPRNFGLAASVGSNALTVALTGADGNDPSAANRVRVPFRSATAATGAPVWREVTAASSLVISSGSTMGFANGTAGRLWIVLFDDAGTLRLGAVNCLSGFNVMSLADDMIASSTAEGGAGGADSAQTIYTGTAVTSKALRVQGYMDWASGLTTAGTWDTGPSKIQLFGPGVPLPGAVVQSCGALTNALDSTTTTIPFDNTIPQNTEGKEFLSAALTPRAAMNILRHRVQLSGAVTAGNVTASVALFQDSTANALAASWDTSNGSTGTVNLGLAHVMRAGTTSSTTFKVRAGPASNTFVLNGNAAGAQIFNGVAASTYEIQEVMG